MIFLSTDRSVPGQATGAPATPRPGRWDRVPTACCLHRVWPSSSLPSAGGPRRAGHSRALLPPPGPGAPSPPRAHGRASQPHLADAGPRCAAALSRLLACVPEPSAAEHGHEVQTAGSEGRGWLAGASRGTGGGRSSPRPALTPGPPPASASGVLVGPAYPPLRCSTRACWPPALGP